MAEVQKEEVAKKEKMVRVKVLRPFMLNGTIIDPNAVKEVDVPESQVSQFTTPVKGHVKGFGEYMNDETAHHDLKRAERV